MVAEGCEPRYNRFSAIILKWFATNKRDFPWRKTRDPYAIAVAEIMLQKTAARNVVDIYVQFMERYPTVKDLASASEEEVALMIKPLGLPRRSSLLLKLASVVDREYKGKFPRSEQELRRLPGIGPYGAAAIASQAFGMPAPMIDINVMRVFSRVFSIPIKPRNGPSRMIGDLIRNMMPPGEEQQYNLALLDFGAAICCAKRPKCQICPVALECDSYAQRVARAHQ